VYKLMFFYTYYINGTYSTALSYGITQRSLPVTWHS